MNKKLVMLSLVALVLLSYGLYLALEWSPPINVPVTPGQDPEVMSNIFRIFYYHVPSAWTAFLCFIANFVASLWYLKRRRPAIDAFALATAEVGLVFCTIVLLTGPIWAKPVWGMWWTWDARLTSTLILWLIYASYLILRRYSTGGQMPVMAAALAVFGFIDVIFVYMAIRWFRTQHPQPVIGGGAESGIAGPMLYTLLMNFAAFLVFGGIVVWMRYRLERARQQFEEAQATASLAARSTR